MSRVFVVLCAAIVSVSCQCDKSILPELTYRLSGSNFDWPCQPTKNIYTTTGRYTARNVIATRAQIYKDNALVALPRYKGGVPITLGIVNMKKGCASTPIAPFPCWSLQEEGNCQALQSVVDLFVDDQVSSIVFFLPNYLSLFACMLCIFVCS